MKQEQTMNKTICNGLGEKLSHKTFQNRFIMWRETIVEENHNKSFMEMKQAINSYKLKQKYRKQLDL